MLNALPTDKKEILLIAHNSDYDCRFIVSGVIQQFITKCVVGGRVMTNSNKQYHVKKTIADL